MVPVLRLLFTSWLLFGSTLFATWAVVSGLGFRQIEIVLPAFLDLAFLPLLQSAALLRWTGTLRWHRHLDAWRRALSRQPARWVWTITGCLLLAAALERDAASSPIDAGRVAVVFCGVGLLLAAGLLWRAGRRRRGTSAPRRSLSLLSAAVVVVASLCLSPATAVLWSDPPVAESPLVAQLAVWCFAALGLIALTLVASPALGAPATTLAEAVVIPGVASLVTLVPCLHMWPLIHLFWFGFARSCLLVATACLLTAAISMPAAFEAPARRAREIALPWRWWSLAAVLVVTLLVGRLALQAFFPLRWSWSAANWSVLLLTPCLQALGLCLARSLRPLRRPGGEPADA